MACWSMWTLEVDVNSWVSLRRICTDELAGSSFRAVRASQESRSVNQRTSNLDESLFSLETSQIRKSDPSQWCQCPILIYSLETLLALSSKAVEKDLISWEEKQTSKMFWSRCLRKYTRTLRLHALHPQHLIQAEQCPAYARLAV